MDETKNVVIRVKKTYDSSKIEDGAVLLYDKKNSYYYIATKKELLESVNSEIGKMGLKIDEISKSESDFEKKIQESQEQFLLTYKETMNNILKAIGSTMPSEK